MDATSSEDRAQKLNKLKQEIRSVLIACKTPLTVGELQSEYSSIMGPQLPFREYGFGNIDQFIDSMHDVVTVDLSGGQKRLRAVTHPSTRHIESLVARQKPAKKSTKSVQKLLCTLKAAKNKNLKPAQSLSSTQKVDISSKWYDGLGLKDQPHLDWHLQILESNLHQLLAAQKNYVRLEDLFILYRKMFGVDIRFGQFFSQQPIVALQTFVDKHPHLYEKEPGTLKYRFKPQTADNQPPKNNQNYAKHLPEKSPIFKYEGLRLKNVADVQQKVEELERRIVRILKMQNGNFDLPTIFSQYWQFYGEKMNLTRFFVCKPEKALIKIVEKFSKTLGIVHADEIQQAAKPNSEKNNIAQSVPKVPENSSSVSSASWSNVSTPKPTNSIGEQPQFIATCEEQLKFISSLPKTTFHHTVPSCSQSIIGPVLVPHYFGKVPFSNYFPYLFQQLPSMPRMGGNAFMYSDLSPNMQLNTAQQKPPASSQENMHQDQATTSQLSNSKAAENDRKTQSEKMQQLKLECRKLLQSFKSGIPYVEFPHYFLYITGKHLHPSEYGFWSLRELIESMPDVFVWTNRSDGVLLLCEKSENSKASEKEKMENSRAHVSKTHVTTTDEIVEILWREISKLPGRRALFKDVRKLFEKATNSAFPESNLEKFAIELYKYGNVLSLDFAENKNTDKFVDKLVLTAIPDAIGHLQKSKTENGASASTSTPFNAKAGKDREFVKIDEKYAEVNPWPDDRLKYSAIPVIITHYVSPVKFYIRLPSFDEKCRDLRLKMRAYFLDTENRKMAKPSRISNSMVCAYECQENDTWYRAMVFDSKDPKKIGVILVDYGKEKYVRENFIYLLPRQFFDLPAQAIHCRLSNFAHSEGFGVAETERLIRMSGASSNIYATLVSISKDGIPEISLQSDSCDSGGSGDFLKRKSGPAASTIRTEPNAPSSNDHLREDDFLTTLENELGFSDSEIDSKAESLKEDSENSPDDMGIAKELVEELKNNTDSTDSDTIAAIKIHLCDLRTEKTACLQSLDSSMEEEIANIIDDLYWLKTAIQDLASLSK